jgi:hypothetical protein
MYYTIVLIIATIILISALVVVGISLTSGQNKKAFPEYQYICPDYWNANGTRCYPSSFGVNIPSPDKFTGNVPSIQHTGISLSSDKKAIEIIDTNDGNWSGLCDKSSWARTNGIFWDGVSNSNQC